jgi:hypothetical protein
MHALSSESCAPSLHGSVFRAVPSFLLDCCLFLRDDLNVMVVALSYRPNLMFVELPCEITHALS